MGGPKGRDTWEAREQRWETWGHEGTWQDGSGRAGSQWPADTRKPHTREAVGTPDGVRGSGAHPQGSVREEPGGGGGKDHWAPRACGVSGAQAPPPTRAWVPGTRACQRLEELLEHSPQASSRWHSGPAGSSGHRHWGTPGCVCARPRKHCGVRSRGLGSDSGGGYRRAGAPCAVTATGFLSQTLSGLAGASPPPASRRAAPPFCL